MTRQHAVSVSGLLLALISSGGLPPAASAQSVSGVVFDASTREPIEAAEISLRTEDGEVLGRVLSNASGSFQIQAPDSGSFRLAARRLGYVEYTSDPIRLDEGRRVEVELALSFEAIPLEPLTVVRERAEPDAYIQRRGFYERRDLYRKHGVAYFFEGEDLRHAFYVSDVLRQVPGARHVSMGRRSSAIFLRRGCAPEYYLNGHPLKLGPGETVDDAVGAGAIVAMEVYPHMFGPMEYYPGRCGSVVIWTGVRK